MVARPRAARHRDLAFGVEGLLPAHRRDDDGTGVAHAEDLGARIDLAYVDQAPRPELELDKTFAVRAQGHFVVDPGGHVAEVRGGNVLARHRLPSEDSDPHLSRSGE